MSCYPCSDCGMHDGNHRGGCSELKPDGFEREQRVRRSGDARYPLLVSMTRAAVEAWLREWKING